MKTLVWTDDLNTGIDVIDGQHRRIADSINKLNLALNSPDADPDSRKKIVHDVIDEMTDYTLFHFTFEEAMMDDVDYPFAGAHKRLHELFAEQIAQYNERNQAGEDVAQELHGLLCRWLFNHIRNEDAAYVPDVMEKLEGHRLKDSQQNGKE
jgi:hemerythrin